MNEDLRKLFDAVSARYNIGDYDSFTQKMQTPEQRKSFYDAVNKQGYDLGDYDSYEKRLNKVPVPKGISIGEMKQTAEKETNRILTQNMLGIEQPIPEITDLMTPERKKEILDRKYAHVNLLQQDYNKRLAEFEAFKESLKGKKLGPDAKSVLVNTELELKGLKKKIDKELNKRAVEESVGKEFEAKTARGLDMAGNYLFGIPRGLERMDDIAEKNLNNVWKILKGAKSAINPLGTAIETAKDIYQEQTGQPFMGPADQIAEHYAKKVDELNEIVGANSRASMSVEQAIKNKDYKRAGINLLGSIIESTPTSLMMMTPAVAGAGTAGVFGTIAITSGTQFADQNLRDPQLKDVPDEVKVWAGMLSGIPEGLFETFLGSGAVAGAFMDVIKKKGAEQGAKEIAGGIAGWIRKLYAGSPLLAESFGNGIEEVATQVSQNWVDKYVLGKNVKLTDGLVDSGLAGAGQGTLMGGATKLAKVVAEQQRKVQQREELFFIKRNVENKVASITNKQNGQIVFAVDNKGDKYHIIEKIDDKAVAVVNPETGERKMMSEKELSVVNSILASDYSQQLLAEITQQKGMENAIQAAQELKQEQKAQFFTGQVIEHKGQRMVVDQVEDDFILATPEGGDPLESQMEIPISEASLPQEKTEEAQPAEQQPKTSTIKLAGKDYNTEQGEDGSFFIPVESDKEAKQIEKEVDTDNFTVEMIEEEQPIEGVPVFAKTKTQKIFKGVRITPKAKTDEKADNKTETQVAENQTKETPQEGTQDQVPEEVSRRNDEFAQKESPYFSFEPEIAELKSKSKVAQQAIDFISRQTDFSKPIDISDKVNANFTSENVNQLIGETTIKSRPDAIRIKDALTKIKNAVDSEIENRNKFVAPEGKIVYGTKVYDNIEDLKRDLRKFEAKKLPISWDFQVMKAIDEIDREQKQQSKADYEHQLEVIDKSLNHPNNQNESRAILRYFDGKTLNRQALIDELKNNPNQFTTAPYNLNDQEIENLITILTDEQQGPTAATEAVKYSQAGTIPETTGETEVTEEVESVKKDDSVISENTESKDEIPDIVKRAMLNPITDIGQLGKNEKKSLNLYVKKGVLAKGRGGPFPALKTVYALAGYDFVKARNEVIEQVKQIDEYETSKKNEVAQQELNFEGPTEVTLKQPSDGQQKADISAEANTQTENVFANPEDKSIITKLEDFGEKIGGARKDMGITRTVRDEDSLPAWRRKYSFTDGKNMTELGAKVDTTKPFFVQWAKEVDTWNGKRTRYTIVTALDSRQPKIFNSEEEAEAYIPIYEVDRQGFRVRKSGDNYVISKSSSTGKVIEYATFPTQEEANVYMYSTEGATSLLNHKREDFSIPALDKVERTGKDWRNGKDVTTDEFMKAFGFRGGEFGNWVKPEERRVMLNAAYDSFMDLAELLNVPPRSLSLGGELSIAFGARGMKGAAAHFEPDRAVINLTRMNGAGSLAHEWAHALDNYFGLQGAKKDYTRDEKGEIAAGRIMRTESGLLSRSGMRKELSDLFDAIIDATQEKTVTRVMGVEEKQRTYDKFKTNVQREADDLIRKFENGARKFQYNRKTKQREETVVKATPAQIEKLKGLINKIISGEGTKPKWDIIPGSKSRFGDYSYISPETLAINELYKEVFGKSGLKRDGSGFYNLGYYADKMYSAKDVLDKALAGNSETLKVPTEYLRWSKVFDKSRAKPYWATKLEMFARAFEYFIEEKLLSKNQRADYLQYDKAPVYDAVYGKNPYPAGEERATINEAFEKFFKAVQTREEGDKTILFKRSAISKGTAGMKRELDAKLLDILIKFNKRGYSIFYNGIRPVITKDNKEVDPPEDLLDDAVDYADYMYVRMNAKFSIGGVIKPAWAMQSVSPLMNKQELAETEAILKDLASRSKARVNIVRSQNQLAGAIRRQINPGERVKGVNLGNLSYIVLDNLESKEEAIRTFIHEVGVHDGIGNIITDREQRIAFFEKVVDDIGMERIKEVVPETEWGLPKHLLGEEYIAYLAEKHLNGETLTMPELTIWQRFIELINEVLRKLGVNVKITDQDVLKIAKDAIESNIPVRPADTRYGRGGNENPIGQGTKGSNQKGTDRNGRRLAGEILSGPELFKISSRDYKISEYPKSLSSVISSTNIFNLKSNKNYEKAKREGNAQAGYDLAKEIVKPNVIEAIKNIAATNERVYLIPVNQTDVGYLNAIPSAYAQLLSDKLGIPVAKDVQYLKNTPNTGATLEKRLNNEILYEGFLPEEKANYIVVDDVYTSGNTIISLINFIKDNGGNPIAATTLASGRYGRSIIPSEEFLEMIKKIPNFVHDIQTNYGKGIEYFTGTELQALSLQKRGSSQKNPETPRGTGENISGEQNQINIRFKRSAPQQTASQPGIGPQQKRKPERVKKGGWDDLRQAMTDSKIAVKRFQEKVKELGGKITKTTDPYNTENHYHGRVLAAQRKYEKEIQKPLLEVITKVKRAGKLSFDELYLYLKHRHAPERNDYFRELQLNQYAEKVKNDPNSKQLIDDYRKAHKDDVFSGFTDQEARDGVRKIEARIKDKALINELWSKINSATGYTLDSWLKYGIISLDVYNELKARWKFYVPLRGWKLDPEEDVFDYDRDISTIFNSIKKAEGRLTESDNPLPYIFNMANTAIISGEKNRIKQAAARMVSANKNILDNRAGYKRIFLVEYEDQNGNPIVEEFDSRPSDAYLKDKKMRVVANAPYASKKSAYQAKQNEVELFIQGEKYIIWFEDPAVAQAINNNVSQKLMAFSSFMQNGIETKIGGKTVSVPGIGQMTRFISSMLTSRNPDFVIANIARDVPLAILSHYVEGSISDMGKFVKNLGRVQATILRGIRGKLDPTIPLDRMYNQFVEEGGRTGFVHLVDVDSFKSTLENEVRRMERMDNFGYNMATAPLRGFKTAMKAVDALSMWSEDMSRFATYVTARENGKSSFEAISEAKNVTVNFNKKGTVSSLIGTLYAFFNASMQGVVKYKGLWAKNWGKMAFIHSVLMAQGYLISLLMDLFGGDDEDKEDKFNNYDKLNEYKKANYLNIPVVNVSVPMPHIFRFWHYAGTLAYDVTSGRKKPEDAILNGLAHMPQDFVPIDASGFKNNQGEWQARPLVPTSVIPFYDWNRNENFMQMPIYKKPFTVEQQRIIADSKQYYDNVNPAIRKFTDSWFKLWGGTETGLKYKHVYKNGEFVKTDIPQIGDINPEWIENMFEGYFGGFGRFINNIYKTGTNVMTSAGELVEGKELGEALKNVDVNSLPVFHRFILKPYGDPVMDRYWDEKRVNSAFRQDLKSYEKLGNVDKITEYFSSVNQTKLAIFDAYQEAIDQVDQAIESQTDKETIKDLEETKRMLVKNYLDAVDELKTNTLP
jgi:hypothetical protein